SRPAASGRTACATARRAAAPASACCERSLAEELHRARKGANLLQEPLCACSREALPVPTAPEFLSTRFPSALRPRQTPETMRPPVRTKVRSRVAALHPRASAEPEKPPTCQFPAPRTGEAAKSKRRCAAFL